MTSRDKFSQLLRGVLVALSQLLEVATMEEVGRHAEELLTSLRSSVKRDATNTIYCVQQVRVCVHNRIVHAHTHVRHLVAADEGAVWNELVESVADRRRAVSHVDTCWLRSRLATWRSACAARSSPLLLHVALHTVHTVPR